MEASGQLKNQKFALLGCSSGLGACVAAMLCEKHPEIEFFFSSRKILGLKEPPFSLSSGRFIPADFSKTQEQIKVIDELSAFKPSHLFYFAGGGPYGPFASKEWKDHEWAIQVSFLFPAKLLHWALQNGVQQLVCVGSAIAEEEDVNAASYSASKAALKALILSVNKESKNTDVRLFSPDYMDTKMLPANAWPRQQGVLNPQKLAHEFIRWIFDADGLKHRVYKYQESL